MPSLVSQHTCCALRVHTLAAPSASLPATNQPFAGFVGGAVSVLRAHRTSTPAQTTQRSSGSPTVSRSLTNFIGIILNHPSPGFGEQCLHLETDPIGAPLDIAGPLEAASSQLSLTACNSACAHSFSHRSPICQHLLLSPFRFLVHEFAASVATKAAANVGQISPPVRKSDCH
jgi:hypothetical protein